MFFCAKAVCSLVRAHYLRPQARARFVRELMATYGFTRRRARKMASVLARETAVRSSPPP